MNDSIPALSTLLLLALPASAGALPASQDPVHDGRTLSEWAGDLASEDALARRRAVSSLGDLAAQGEKAAAAAWPHLLAALEDAEEGVRWQAVNELRMRGAIAGEEAVAAAVPRLFPLLEDPRWTIRQQALDALATLAPGHADLTDALLQALDDPERGVRASAADALARVAPPDVSVPRLVALIDDPDWQVAVRAAQELGGLGAEAAPAVERILALHVTPPEGLDPRELATVRSETAGALGAIGPGARAAAPALAEALRSDDEKLRRKAAAALVAIGAPGEAVFVFADELAREDPYRRAEALEQLGKIGAGAAPALGAIALALRDPDSRVRWSAASTLAAIGPAAAPAVPGLTEALGDEESLVRDNALGALAAIGPGASADVLPALLGALDDERVARQAIDQIARIGTDAAPAATAIAARLGDEDLGYGAQKALVAIGAGAAPALAEALDETAARKRALAALRELGPDAEPAVPRLIPLLSDRESRFDVNRVLEAVGAGAVEPLRAALAAEDPDSRAGAAEALAGLGPAAEPALAELVAMLGDETAGYHASKALEAIGEPAIAPLAGRLGADGIEGLQAGTVLQRLGAAALPALIDAVASDDDVARRNAAFALQRMGPAAAEAIPALEAALAHESTRSFVERALAAIRGD